MRIAVALSVVLVPVLALAAPTERRVFSSDADASSYYKSETWEGFTELGNPNYALDDDATTAWLESSPGSGVGEWLRVDLAPLDKTTKIKLKIRNGCQQKKDSFAQNARAKDVTIKLLPSGVEKKVTLADKAEWQDVVLEQASGPIKAVELKVGSVIEGKTKDLCIADVQVFATSEVASIAAFESSKQKAIADWRASRAAYAKISAKQATPLPASYDVVTTDGKVSGTGLAPMIAATEKDKVMGMELKWATNRAKKFVETLATTQRATITIKPGMKLPASDGVQLPTFNDIAEGDFDEDSFRMPMLAGAGVLFRDQITVTDSKDKLAPDEWFKKAGACSGGDVAWVARGDTSESTGAPVVQVLLIGRCAMVVGRGSMTPRAHRERELYLFGPEGQIELVIAETHVEGYSWGLVRGKPMIRGAHSILPLQGKRIEAREHEGS